MRVSVYATDYLVAGKERSTETASQVDTRVRGERYEYGWHTQMNGQRHLFKETLQVRKEHEINAASVCSYVLRWWFRL